MRSRDGVPERADVVERCGGDRAAGSAVVAAARLAAVTGAPLASVLDRVGAALAEEADIAARRRAAFAGPQATVRLLTWLPAFGLVLGVALGADPMGVLLDGRGGTGLLVASVLLTSCGRRWGRRLLDRAAHVGTTATASARRARAPRRRVSRVGPSAVGGGPRGVGPRDIGPYGIGRHGRDGQGSSGDQVEVEAAVVLDLLDAACAAGASVPGALEAVGVAVGGARGGALSDAAATLRLGAPWVEAWAGAGGALEPVGVALRPSWDDGVAPAGSLRAVAAALRLERRSRAAEAAGRLGVRLVLPLGLCHLPAFVLVGLVPVLVSMTSRLG